MKTAKSITLNMSSDSFVSIALGDLAAVTGGGQIDVARIWGGGSAEKGWSWAPVSEIGPDYRNRAGLPNVNSAHSITMGTVDEGATLQRRAALPLDGNAGGMQEFIINPASVNVTGATSLGAPM